MEEQKANQAQNKQGTAGILTFSWAWNYGAILQAYALSRALQDYFAQVRVVDYAPPQYTDIYRLFGNKSLKGVVKDILQLPQLRARKLRDARFAAFIKESLPLTAERYQKRGELQLSGFDQLFFGSDQVWNPDLTGGFDPVYFGAVETAAPCRKIAYAASAGKSFFPAEEEWRLAALLHHFDAVSVREKSLKKLLERHLAEPPRVTLDPTLLLPREAWRQVGRIPAEIAAHTQKPYLLLYSVAGYQSTRRLAQRVAQEQGLQLIELANSGRSPKRRYPHPTVDAAGPAEFVGLFDQAAFIATDSFHGTAFSLVFEKDFYTVPHQTRGNRMRDLLRTVGLAERLVTDEADLAAVTGIDYSQPRVRLRELQGRSRDFLSAAIAGQTPPLADVAAPPQTALYDEKSDCCGCSACLHSCPSGAIRLVADAEGFRYPQIDTARCTDCGACRRVCAFQNSRLAEPNRQPEQIFAFKHRAPEVRAASSSGGLFTAISDWILAQGGVVYGAAYDENLRVVHQRAETAAMRDRMRGSKYVQSDTEAAFAQAAADLAAGRIVLFSGTPCQTEGLDRYLQQNRLDTRNLYLCDLVCHGVPSPLLFAEYLADCGQAAGSAVVDHQFRSKVRGWHNHTECNIYANGQRDDRSARAQSFRTLFYAHTLLRPSCHHCRYTAYQRPSDLTLADFRGIEKHFPQFDDDRGVSLAIVQTAKGRAMFDAASAGMEILPATREQCRQPNLLQPTRPGANREALWRLYRSQGAAAVFHQARQQTRRSRLKAPLRKLVTLWRNR